MPKVRTADGLDGLRALEDDWERLHAASGAGLFQSFAWHAAWCEAINGQDYGDIRVLTVEDDGLCCIVPLIVRRQFGVRRLRWLGMEATDYCDAIAAQRADMPPWSAAIRTHLPAADSVELRQIATNSLAGRLFQAAPAAASSPLITVGNNARPKEILYAERRAAATGALNYQVAPTVAERSELVEFLILHKRLALLRHGEDTTEFDRVTTGFLRTLARLDFPTGCRPYFSGLTLGGQTMAVQVGFIEGKTMFYYLPAFDFASQLYSPGHLLILNLLRDAARMGLDTIDLLRGHEPYKFKWADTAKPVLAAEWAQTWRGRAFDLARRVKKRARWA